MKTLAQKIKKDEVKKNIFLVLLGLIAVFFVMYGLAITQTTINIADANTHNQSMDELQTEIAELEIEYFEIIDTLSLDQAIDYGFTEIFDVQYALVDSTKAVAYNF